MEQAWLRPTPGYACKYIPVRSDVHMHVNVYVQNPVDDRMCVAATGRAEAASNSA